MAFLDRLRALFRGPQPDAPPETSYDELLEERILSSPDERTQLEVTTEGEREARLDEGRSGGPER